MLPSTTSSFSYELETWGKAGPEQVWLHLDNEGSKAVCPIYVPPDYFGMVLGEWSHSKQG